MPILWVTSATVVPDSAWRKGKSNLFFCVAFSFYRSDPFPEYKITISLAFRMDQETGEGALYQWLSPIGYSNTKVRGLKR